jgi:hypothetical protein
MSEEFKVPQRVSITYSVDFSEVPDRVKILMTELANSFGGIAKACREASAEVTQAPVSGTRSLADLKSLVDKASVRIEDSIEIMLGYIRILQQVAEIEDAANATVSDTAPPEAQSDDKPSEKKAAKKKAKKKTTKKKTTKKKED